MPVAYITAMMLPMLVPAALSTTSTTAYALGWCALVTALDAVAIGALLQNYDNPRVLYLDFDAHHGDGVQALFYDDPRVLTAAAGADVCVAAAVVLPAFVAPDDVVIDDAVKVALVPARTDAAAAMLGLLLLDPHPETAVARASRTAPAIILFMFDSFARCLCTGARRIAGSHRGCPSL